MKTTIIPAYQQINQIKLLFQEYTDSLNIDLSYQNYEQELRELPGKYAHPAGRLYLAKQGVQTAGCIALRSLDQQRGEIKRLYVRPQFRKQGLGHRLIQQVIDDAKEMQLEELLLDTLPKLKDAIKVYQNLGFKKINPYYDSPIQGTTYWRLSLTASKRRAIANQENT